MKTLYLVRHAEAIPRDVGVNDFKRALTKSGKNDAQTMSRRLHKKGIQPDVLISSPADRALETAHIFAAAFGYPVQKIVLHEDIYDKDAQVLQGIIMGLAETDQTAALFGHDPALSDLAKMFLPDFEGALRKSGVLGIAFNVTSWPQIGAETATLLVSDFPVRVTPKVYKKARKTLKREISATLADILAQIHVSASKQVARIIQKTSKRMAKDLVKMLEAAKVEELAGVKKGQRVEHHPAGQPPVEASVVAADLTQPPPKTPGVAAETKPLQPKTPAAETDPKPRKPGQRRKPNKK